jgi:hypothetical protein
MVKMTKYEVQKGEWRVHYGEGRIASAGHKTWGDEKCRRDSLLHPQSEK